MSNTLAVTGLLVAWGQGQNRAHFLAVAARLMRRILCDFARSKQYQKRQAPAPMTPVRMAGPVDLVTPPLVEPGMIRVRLDPAGGLQDLMVVPTDLAQTPGPWVEPAWDHLLVVAGQKPGEWQATEPLGAPPYASDGISPCGAQAQTYDWPAAGYGWGIMISAPEKDDGAQPGRTRDVCIGTNPVRLRVSQNGVGSALVTIAPQLLLKAGLVGGGGTYGPSTCAI